MDCKENICNDRYPNEYGTTCIYVVQAEESGPFNYKCDHCDKENPNPRI